MIVPQFWAESRLQEQQFGKQVTLRRFGWSDASQAEAQAHADTRVAEAMRRALAGETLAPRDPKVAYNGAEGVPIREEIISRHGESIITRNSYGARCLNSPNALFADVDFAQPSAPMYGLFIFVALALIALVIGWATKSTLVGISLFVVAVFASSVISSFITRRTQPKTNEAETQACDKIARFVGHNPGWSVRVYKTPAGLRALVTHEPFVANDPTVSAFFSAIGTDPIYAKMCANQQCFRARVSPKPWRIGIGDHMRPRPGIWPINPDRAPIRDAWIARYEAKAASYASCRFVESIGSGIIHPTLAAVIELHDTLSQATISGKEIA
jgi:hypothetical protein